jgi:Lrp/AsnC family leucine-responsive transcriptional regulator
MDNLLKEEILLGTQTIIDNSKMGYEGYRFYFKFSSTTSKEENEVLNWLKDHKAVSVLARCYGSIDVAVMCWNKDKKIFEELINSLKENFRNKTTDLEIFLYSETYHFSRDYLLEKSNKLRQIIKIGNNETEKIDDLDTKILKSIYNNARKSILDISQELKKPPRTIAFRLNQLEKKKIIAGYSINLNIKKIGYEYYKLNVILSKNVGFQDILRFAIEHKNTIYLDKTIGKYDLELNLEIKDNEELQKIIKEIKDRFEGIRELSWFQIDKYYKINYI